MGVRTGLMMPSPSPAASSASPVLTNEEAVRYLRLDEDYNELGDAVRALHRLVQQKRLRALKIGKTYKYTIPELERFTVAEVGPSDADTESNGG